MNFRWFVPLFALAFLALVLTAAGKKSSNDADIPDDYQEEATVTSTPTPLAQTTPSAPKASLPQNGNASNVIYIHKPMPSPSWGKVIQYHQELSQSPSEKTHEILHEFLFQDDQGVIRTATYHESPNGDGYWEVSVWDQ